jgi:Rrf2 family protein
MKISTKGRYALRVMLDLAEQNTDAYLPLKDIAKRTNTSQKYLESIMAVLSKNGLVDGVHGKGGGYRLTRAPKEYFVGEILRLMEGSLAPVACLECGAEPCEYAGECKTLPMWDRLDRLVNDYLDSVSIADLLEKAS